MLQRDQFERELQSTQRQLEHALEQLEAERKDRTRACETTDALRAQTEATRQELERLSHEVRSLVPYGLPSV